MRCEKNTNAIVDSQTGNESSRQGKQAGSELAETDQLVLRRKTPKNPMDLGQRGESQMQHALSTRVTRLQDALLMLAMN